MRGNRDFVAMVVGDSAICIAAYALPFFLPWKHFTPTNVAAMLQVIPTILFVTVLVMVLFNGYRDLHRPFLEVAAACVFVAVATAVAVSLVAYLNVQVRALPRTVWVLGLLGQMLLLPVWRSWFVRAAKDRYFRRPTVLVAAASDHCALELPEYIRVTHRCTASQISLFATPGSLVIVASDVPVDDRESILRWAVQNDVYVHLIPTLYEVLLVGSRTSKLGDRPVVGVRPLRLGFDQQVLKRAMDLTGAALLIIVFAPAWVAIPLALLMTSPGGVLYTQQRVGLGGRLFKVYKFRTMIENAELTTGAVFAQRNDPRVTGVGRLLRATRLDELPQLFNVLRGDMSLVGPRPERPVFVASFIAEDDTYRLRERVKPGITGLAQVMGRYATSASDKLRYDLMYSAQYSVWLDVLVLLWTIPVVLFPQSWADRPPQWLRRLDWSRRVAAARDLSAD